MIKRLLKLIKIIKNLVIILWENIVIIDVLRIEGNN